jgi:RimJ/RimL family protein N-acetyltransferase
MIIIPFLPAHLKGLQVHESQGDCLALFEDEQYGETLFLGEAYTAIVNGVVMGCFGLLPLTPNRGQIWSLLSPYSGKHMAGITRFAIKSIAKCGIKRIEAHVRTDFEQGHRWAKMLGFKREGTMEAYGDDGLDYDLYSRVN